MFKDKPPASLLVVLLALCPLVIALPFAMDIYVPAVPRITTVFHVSDAVMQLTLNLFMLVSGFVQLFVGPITDSYGRTRLTLVSLVCFSIGCLLCAYATSFSMLIFGRVVQAMGSCSMLMLGFAIARDLYTDTKLAVVYSYMNGAIAFSPMFAPFIGSFLDIKFGWPSTFESLLLIPLLALVLYFPLLGETLPLKNRTPLSFKILGSYKRILVHKSFLLFSLANAIGMSYLFVFCATSPVLLIKLLHVPEADYGFYFCFMGLSFFIGSLVSAKIVTRWGIYRTVLIGFAVTLLGGVLMLTWSIVAGLTINSFIWPMLPIGLGGTLCLGASNAGAMIPFGKEAGSASALLGALRFGFAGTVGLVIAHSVHSVLPLAIPALIFSVVGGGLFLIYQHVLRD